MPIKVMKSVIQSVNLPIGKCTVSLNKDGVRYSITHLKRKYSLSQGWDFINSQFINSIKMKNERQKTGSRS